MRNGRNRSSFLPVAVIRQYDKKQIQGGRGFIWLALPGHGESLRNIKKLKQKMKEIPQRDTLYWPALWLAQPAFLDSQDHLPKDDSLVREALLN